MELTNINSTKERSKRFAHKVLKELVVPITLLVSIVGLTGEINSQRLLFAAAGPLLIFSLVNKWNQTYHCSESTILEWGDLRKTRKFVNWAKASEEKKAVWRELDALRKEPLE